MTSSTCCSSIIPSQLHNSATTATANRELRGGDKYGVGDKDGVIIVDHGSRRKESNLLLSKSFFELAEPSIKDAFGSCVRQGANRVIVSPYFLSPGRHWKQDIPSLTAEAAKEHPGVTYLITAPLGLHEQIVALTDLIPCVSQIHGQVVWKVVNDRIKHCISHVAGDAEECAVCVGTGKCRLHHVES
ncbi:hypothetical protein MKX03_037507 [Papaver bracteatum]|nr:hypothetical protein MKX03_037507 [Papaver bracteatum]